MKGKKTLMEVTTKTARSEAVKLVLAARRLKAAGELPHKGETFLALVAESAFLRGASFALRRMAKDIEGENVLKKAVPTPSWANVLPELTDEDLEKGDEKDERQD